MKKLFHIVDIYVLKYIYITIVYNVLFLNILFSYSKLFTCTTEIFC